MADLEEQNRSAKELANNLEEIGKLGAASASNFRDISIELGKSVTNAKNFGGAFRLAKTTSTSLAKDAENLAKASKTDLSNRQNANNLAKQAETNSKNLLSIQRQRQVAQDLLANATEEEKAELNELLVNLFRAEEEARGIAEGFEKIVDENEKLNKSTKFFDNVRDLLKDIPVIGRLFGQPFDEASQKIREAKVDGGNAFQVINAGASAFDNILLTGIVASLFKADTATTNLAKQLGVSKSEARDLKASFNAISVDSGIAALNAEAMAESMIQLGDAIGATAGFTTQQVVDQTKLTRMVGMQAEESAKLAEFGTLNGENTRSLTADILEQVAVLEQETGVRLDGRKILSQVANISGQLGAQYGYNTKELARAVVQANRLGLSLEQTQGVAANLLDFEQSITNELQAELLIGRDLNLERARLLALNGDSAGAAAELAKQFGTAEEFSRLNVIQQQSLAAAVGMSADELADSIKKQEVLNTLGEKNFDTLMQSEQGRERIRTLGGESLLNQLEQQSAADKFQQALQKIQTAFGAIVEGPLGGLIDGMASLAGSAGAVYTALGLIGAVSLVRVIGSVVSLAISLGASAASAATLASGLTLGIGALAVAGGIALIMNAMNDADSGAKQMATMGDGVIPTGFGETIIKRPEGSIALNNNDSVALVAGTNLGQGDKESKRTNELLQTLINQNNSKPKISPVGLYEVQ